MNKVLHGISYGLISYQTKAIWSISTFKEFLNFDQKVAKDKKNCPQK
jgi:hypothetical protein